MKYHCSIDLLFDWFGLVCFANKKQKLSVVIQLIPNQSNRRSMVQCYLVFPGRSFINIPPPSLAIFTAAYHPYPPFPLEKQTFFQ
jgi:hypothetical protein